MAYIITAVVCLLVGAALLYAFRGKAGKAKDAVETDIQNLKKKL